MIPGVLRESAVFCCFEYVWFNCKKEMVPHQRKLYMVDSVGCCSDTSMEPWPGVGSRELEIVKLSFKSKM